MMRLLIITAIGFVLCLNISAQNNLAPNNSFELHTQCPNHINDIDKVHYWQSPNGSSPDFFHVCGATTPSGLPSRGIPENRFGYQQPVSGEAYLGFYGVQMGNTEWREYIQVELTEPLHFRVRYAVSFHVSLCEASRYAISTMGAYLSEDAISSNDLLVLNAEPQILQDPLQPIADTASWVLVTDTFSSRVGGESYITIGNFFSDAQSDTTFVNPNAPLGALHAYYYIDDVSVVAIDSVPNNVTEIVDDEKGFLIYPNPVRETLNVKTTHEIDHFRLYDVQGREVMARSTAVVIRQQSFQLNISDLPTGMYFLEVTDKDGRKLVKRIVKGENP